jgi:hypothetical protein
MTKILLIFSLLRCISNQSIVTDLIKVIHLGNRTCKLVTTGNYSKSETTFLSLHDNENTAVEAYKSVQTIIPNSKLVELNQSEERLVKYEFENKDYLIDPNRIFTKTGIKKTLSNLNKSYSISLESAVAVFADSILNTVQSKTSNNYIVAIHNNTNNDFSVLSYKNSKDAIEIYVASGEDIDDFFIVTNRSDFNYFKSIKRNVVLQSDDAADDGSLSIFCQKRKIPYINIEAQNGHIEQQKKMILEAYLLIKNKIK